MIYLRTFAIAIILIVLSFFSWRCSQDEPITNKTIVNNQTDGPCGGINEEYLTYLVQEYVKITPYEDMPPYYEYRTILDITCCACFTSDCDCGGSPTGLTCFHCQYFTSPDSYRFEGGNLVETQNYKLSFTGSWNAHSGNNCIGLFLRRESPSTYYFHEDDSYLMNVAGTLSFDTTLYTIPENTYIRAQFGRDVCP